MKQFTLAALCAALSSAEIYQQFTVDVDGNDRNMHFRSQDWSTVDVHADGRGISVPNNNYVLIKADPYDGADYAFRPWLRGGAFEYTVDLSSMPCGCVASVHGVRVDSEGCSEEDMASGNSQCQSIDVMQANPYGFNTAAHPCESGNCNAASQCEYNMREQGKEIYGDGAYGPGGSMIDTNMPFTVKTEFISTSNYQTLWALRTRIQQAGSEIYLDADCHDYIDELSQAIEGNMGYVVSAWDNTDGANADFECEGQCPEPASSCDGAVNSISNIKFYQWGYNEDRVEPEPSPEPSPEPEPSPTPQPADFEGFWGYSDLFWDGDWEFYVKGLDNRHLTTSDRTIEMGYNNRAFILDYPYDDGTYWSYWHQYLGGSLDFDVDVSEIPCACAAGVYLAELDDQECSWDAHEDGVTPQCATIDIMEANIWGFNAQSKPCEFGSCEVESQCRRKAGENYAYVYGPGEDYLINTDSPYHVRTEFWSTSDDSAGYRQMVELFSIKTIISQGDNIVHFEQDCDGYIESLTQKLQYNMAMGVSVWDIGTENNVSGATCGSTCDFWEASTKTKISNIVWGIENSYTTEEEEENVEPGEIITGDTTYSLSDCEESDCAECRMAWYENIPDQVFSQCVDYTIYNYGNVCGYETSNDMSRCNWGEGELCHHSYPYGDHDKMESPDAACRTVPAQNIQNDFEFSEHDCFSPVGGLCHYDCDGTCHNSWAAGDELRWKSPTAMCRCMQ